MPRWKRSRARPASASARSTGISRRASIWSRWSTGAKWRGFARPPTTSPADHPPDVALEQWMQRFVDYIADQARPGDQPAHPVHHQLHAVLRDFGPGDAGLAAAGRGGGRRRLDPRRRRQLRRAARAVRHLFGAATPDWRDRSRRLVTLLMDGLRWGAPKASRGKSAAQPFLRSSSRFEAGMTEESPSLSLQTEYPASAAASCRPPPARAASAGCRSSGRT